MTTGTRTAPAAAGPAARDRYIDTLRAAALVRVVTYHLVGWAWLPLVFPSMGIIFALGGSLVAGSLSRGHHWTVLRKRLRRLLPPLWALGLVLVPLMLAVGWTHDPETFSGTPLTWSALLFWVVPVYTPGASEWGANLVLPLWYVRTYLWLLLLSPALLWLWRRWPLRTLAVPLVTLGLMTSGMVVPNGSRTDEVVLSLAVFGGCWLLGFAHHEGQIRRLPLRLVLPVACGLLATGAWWAATRPVFGVGHNIDGIPFANGLWSLGFVLLLLRFYPSFDWMRRLPLLDRTVAAINARAMTIYLWGNAAILMAIVLENRYLRGVLYDGASTAQARWVQYALTWLLLGAIVLAVGWVEDVAARRRPRLNPLSPASAPAPGRLRQALRAGSGRSSRHSPPAPVHTIIDLRDGHVPTGSSRLPRVSDGRSASTSRAGAPSGGR